MRPGHLLDVLAGYSKSLQEYVRLFGVRSLIHFVRETPTGPWLVPVQVRTRLAQDGQRQTPELLLVGRLDREGVVRQGWVEIRR